MTINPIPAQTPSSEEILTLAAVSFRMADPIDMHSSIYQTCALGILSAIRKLFGDGLRFYRLPIIIIVDN